MAGIQSRVWSWDSVVKARWVQGSRGWGVWATVWSRVLGVTEAHRVQRFFTAWVQWSSDIVSFSLLKANVGFDRLTKRGYTLRRCMKRGLHGNDRHSFWTELKHEYVGLRDAQDALMDRIDSYEAALLGLTEAVSRNSEEIAEVKQDIGQLNQKMDALMRHMEVPYKPPAGFIKE